MPEDKLITKEYGDFLRVVSSHSITASWNMVKPAPLGAGLLMSF